MATDTAATVGPWWDREEDQALVCVDVRAETHDVKTFWFQARDDRFFRFQAGQYFLFELEINGEPVSRCYSISSSSSVHRLFSITVKRVPGGKVSNWLHDHLVPGRALQGAGPAGAFTLEAPLRRKVLLISGGVGITPMMSMVRSLSDARQHPDVVFLHAGRTPADLVYRDELLYRAKVTPNFRLVFLPEALGDEPGYAGVTGRVSQALLATTVPDLAQRDVLCCGPAPFMAAVRQASVALGVPPERYFEESFDAAVLEAPVLPPQADPPASGAITFQVTFAKQDKVMQVPGDQLVLAAARQHGVSIPSSCGNGLCGTCKSKLVSGQVDMQHTGGIRKREVDAGFFLPCCSKPLSDLVIDR